MGKFIIDGKCRLVGKVKIDGAKNSAVALLPATLLADEGVFTISNLPNIEDIDNLIKTIEYLGGKVTRIDDSTINIDNTNINTHLALNDETSKMRASYYLLGPLLNKYGKVELNYPGGCSIGTRPIDLHLKALEDMGASTIVEHGTIKVTADSGLVGTNIYFDVVTVGATINVMLAAVKAKGTTIIKNAAKEPHIVDVANFLNKMGAHISGAGTDTIKIKGVEKLVACSHSVVPDQIEAGSYMIAAVATQGDVLVTNIIPNQLEFLTKKLEEAGATLEINKTSIRVSCNERPRTVDIKTAPHPGFATDLQQPMSALLAVSEGRGVIVEQIWENRHIHLNEMRKTGVVASVEGKVAIIDGTDNLTGAEMVATDLRGGFAMLIIGLIAEGTTTVSNIIHIDRGYSNVEQKLTNLGAKITRVSK